MLPFGRAEVAGMDRMIAGLAMAHPEDEERLARGAALLDDLHTYYTRRRVGAEG
ncbi:MAG: chromate resistance protein [Deltaproteobacteria bacterium]|nr:chromate resistance protein [Deltaproteobacteria bacterium]